MSDVLVHSIRDLIRREGPISFARFMEQSLYHPEHGYYSSGRAEIGRRGDYFTSVSVGPLFGRLMTAQFAQIWELLGQPNDFVLCEQGAHHGEFAADVLEEARTQWPGFFSALRYRIVEPFPLLRRRQEGVLRPFADHLEWVESVGEMEPFLGVHFSNELLDSFPVHLLKATGPPEGREWQERLVERTSCGFTFIERPITEARLLAQVVRLPPPPASDYETEINLAALDWIGALAKKVKGGVVLVADYGWSRGQFFAPERSVGSIQGYAGHRRVPSPLDDVGLSDISAHVEWTSLAERAEAAGLTIAGFTDQHHFLTGLFANDPALAERAAQNPRTLHTLLHPELLGTRFQFLALAKGMADCSLAGFRFQRNPREQLELTSPDSVPSSRRD